MSATPTDTIVMATVVITGSTLIKNAKNKKNHFAPIVFGFMLTSALLIMAMFAPTFAKMLAYMGMAGAFVVNGPSVFGVVSGIGKK
jgi:hypothetical protein